MIESSGRKTNAANQPVTLPYAPAMKRPKIPTTPLAYLLAAAVVVMLVSFLLPSFSGGPLGPRDRCGFNLRRIGQAAALYCAANPGQFPPDLQTLVGLGLCAQGDLISPWAKHMPPACDYYYVCGVAADDPGDWILAYADRVYEKGEGANILYRDGRVDFVCEPKFSQELQRFKAAYTQARGIPPTIIPPQ